MRPSLTDIVVEVPTGKISWKLNGDQRSLLVTELEHVFYDSSAGVIAAISRGPDEARLLVIAPDGGVKHELAAPPGFDLSHIVEHPEHGLCVVCNGDQEINGWYDWYFKVDSRRGMLVRVSPSY